MALTSFSFILLLAACALVMRAVPPRWRYLALLLASVVFYVSYGAGHLLYVLLCAVVSYGAAILIERVNARARGRGDKAAADADLKRKRALLYAALAVDLGMLAAFKYTGMFYVPARDWAAPLGISFYTLSAIGYMIDVYRGKYAAARNFPKFGLFLLSFLRVVQGPFARYDRFEGQISQPQPLVYQEVKLGAMRMLWGFFKKGVVADWLGVYVSAALEAPASQNGCVMLITMALYTLQIYADFSGYMDIVTGAGRALGVTVEENFDRPLMSRSVAEFWRRWHITLGAWFKDYVFFPVSISRPAVRLGKRLRKGGRIRLAKLAPALLALAAVWPLTGLWHGATVNYLLWGLLNGAAIALSMLLEPFFARALKKLGIKSDSRGWRAFQVARTFLLLSLIRLFARTPTLGDAFSALGALGNWAAFNPLSLDSYFPGLRDLHMFHCGLAALFAVVMLLVERLGRPDEMLKRFDRMALPAKYALGLVLLYVVILFTATGASLSGGFLYANF